MNGALLGSPETRKGLVRDIPITKSCTANAIHTVAPAWINEKAQSPSNSRRQAAVLMVLRSPLRFRAP